MAVKTDMERVGLFQEMGYHTVGDPYISRGIYNFNEAGAKGKQMIPGGNTLKSALDDGYFLKPFARILEGEAYIDQIQLRRVMRRNAKSKNIGKDWHPPSKIGPIDGVGTHHGTFSGPIESFDPTTKKIPPPPPRKPLYTNPGKKGTGYGYLDVTIGKYPPHAHEDWNYHARRRGKLEQEDLKKVGGRRPFTGSQYPQAYFDPNPYAFDGTFPYRRTPPPPEKKKPFIPSHPGKASGGCKAGTFDPFPSYSYSPYGVRYQVRPVHVVNAQGKTFYPPMGPKTTIFRSVMQQNVVKRMNVTNYKTFERAY